MDLAKALRHVARPHERSQRIGVVTSAVAAGQIGVNLDGAVNVYPVAAGLAPAVGDTVVVLRDGLAGGIVVARVGTPAQAPSFPVNMQPPPVGATLRTAVVLPIRTRTFRSGAFLAGDRVYQGTRTAAEGAHLGYVEYGTQLRGLGAMSGQPHNASLAYRRVTGGAAAALSPRLNLNGVLAVLPALTVGQTREAELPQAFVTNMLTVSQNASFLVDGADYLGLAGASEWAEAFALTITYYS